MRNVSKQSFFSTNIKRIIIQIITIAVCHVPEKPEDLLSNTLNVKALNLTATHH